MVQTLDVGSGDRPKGDVNVDKTKGKTEHLQGYRGYVDTRKGFVQATVYHLPFLDNSFETVLCHHLLEHLDRPSEAIQELVRVSKNVVEIVVPFRWHELIQNWFLPFRREWMRKHHLWNFDKQMLTKLCEGVGVNVKVRYRYKFIPVIENVTQFRLSFKQFIVYGLLDTLLPPTPSELVATIYKNGIKPKQRAR